MTEDEFDALIARIAEEWAETFAQLAEGPCDGCPTCDDEGDDD